MDIYRSTEMSNSEILRRVLEKHIEKVTCDHNALNTDFFTKMLLR